MLTLAAAAILAPLAALAGILALLQASDAAQRGRVRAALLALRDPSPARFDPAMTAGLPDIAQRYFARAIAPGTPLHRVVTLRMEGTFILNGRSLPMQARQILAPPSGGFVWQARVGTGAMAFSGSDGALTSAAGTESWTKFALHGLIPLVRAGRTADHARAAATRVMLESLWVPATLLPQSGARWVQTGPDSARISFDSLPDLPPLDLTLDAAGDPVELCALRWSDANPDRIWRLQPFGGRVLETGCFGGFRIPVRVDLGNLWGTPDHVPFFLARITGADHQ